MATEKDPSSFRVLMLPPTGRDAEVLCKVLEPAEIDCAVFTAMNDLCGAIAQGAGAVLISEEALSESPNALSCLIRAQPVWSDLPLIVLSRAGAETPTLGSVMASLGNVSVLERPVRMSTLISVVRSALRARARQYEVQQRLSEIATAEAARKELLESERAARGEAERASRMKDEFLATLSHELRTPLNAILGWTIILSRLEEQDEDVKTGIEVIERNARAQAKIIEELLDMSRIISGKVQLDAQPADLVELVLSAIETARPAAAAKGLQLSSEIEVSTLPMLADSNRMQQVLWNLLSNAVKFTPRGGTVQLKLRQTAVAAEVSVVDSGEGIAAAFLPFVFDRFRQADASTTRRHGGLGLGLGIVKQLVELHGGSVQAKSEGVGQGTTMTISLPIRVAGGAKRPGEKRAESAGRTEDASAASNASGTSQRLQGFRLLVVDDEPDARMLTQRLLEDCGATVIPAGSAAEAFAHLQASPPDALISDIGMPDEDGYMLIQRIRQLAPVEGGNVPALALTAYARSEDRQQSRRAGFQKHLSKPVEPNELISQVLEMVAHPRAAAPLAAAAKT